MHSGELTTLFEGREVRVIERDGEPWFPLFDLAAAWGVDRKTPGNLVDRNKELFAGMFHSDGDVTYHDVNERGLYVLMGKISADRLKNPEAKAAMIRFQRWVPELIQKYRKKEIVQSPTAPSINTEMQLARELAEQTGGNLRAFQKIALGKCGHADYAPALDETSQIIKGVPGWFTPTQLAALLHVPMINAERLNHYLNNNPRDPERRPFQYRDENRLWRLTPLGMEHGREYQFHGQGGHIEPRIEWKESILVASGLKRPVDASQIALPVRA